jgi:hypothetical protein
MSAAKARIVILLSHVLTKEKQRVAQGEFDRYASAVNFVIKSALAKHIAGRSQLVEAIKEEFRIRFDSRPEYLIDAVKTARLTIAHHRKMARVIRSMRDRSPFFKMGTMVFSPPLISIDETGLTLTISRSDSLPVPFDKHSRNKEGAVLHEIAAGRAGIGRVRLVWRKEGFLEIAFRIHSDTPRPGSQCA